MRIDGDATLLISWLMDAVLLWAVGRLIGRSRGLGRLAAGAAVGTAPTLMALGGFPGPDWVVLAATPLCMVWMYLAPVPRASYWRGVAWLLGLAAAAGGGATALYEAGLPLYGALVGSGLGIWAATGLWRGQVVPRLRRREGLVTVRLWLERAPHELTALVDNGNRLQDVNGDRPVAVADWGAVRSMLSPDVMRWVTGAFRGARLPVPRGADLWLLEVRTATGRRRLPVLAVAHAEWEVDGQWQPLGPLALALTDQTLSPNGTFQILLPDLPSAPVARPGA